MNQISISELKQLNADGLKEISPCEITKDGDVIGVFGANQEEADMSQVKTKCPNCKLVYLAEKPDNTPYFFSLQK